MCLSSPTSSPKASYEYNPTLSGTPHREARIICPVGFCGPYHGVWAPVYIRLVLVSMPLAPSPPRSSCSISSSSAAVACSPSAPAPALAPAAGELAAAAGSGSLSAAKAAPPGPLAPPARTAAVRRRFADSVSRGETRRGTRSS